MSAVSQALIEFANHWRPRAEPGTEVIDTPRYVITLQPDFRIPGPNSVAFVRCRPAETDEIIHAARAIFHARRLPMMWMIDPETEPPDFADHLARHDVHPDPRGSEFAVMVLPIDATIHAPAIAGLEIRDALADLATFRSANAVAAEAFGADIPGDEPEVIAMHERRRLNLRAAGHRYLLLATIDGEPAGMAGIGVFPPAGAAINGGSVRTKFRGRGVYRALLAARLQIARDSGVDGLSVWGGDMSGPILAKLGFEKVGWRRFLLDTSS